MPIYDGRPSWPSYEDKSMETDFSGAGSASLATIATPSGLRESRPSSPTIVYNPYYTGRPRTPVNGGRSGSIDRQEIIRRIKSGEQQQWLPVASPADERPPSSSSNMKSKSPTPLLPAADLHGSSPQSRSESRPRSRDKSIDNLQAGLEIQRPGSALHKGDFRNKDEKPAKFEGFGDVTREEQDSSLSTSPIAPWHPSFPAAAFRQAWEERRTTPTPPVPNRDRPRPRAVSNASLGTSFTYQPPTSPLVYQSSATDELDHTQVRRQSHSPDKNRRHTFSPQSLQNFRSTLDYPQSARGHGSGPVPSLRKGNTFPYQAHQPRRSVTNFSSLPHTPLLGPRRPSISGISSLKHAPMVGSFEESILRGRMSSTPSKPLNFIAQIGVLGRGEFFYSYSGTSVASISDQPSPYVGQIDIHNSLQRAESPPVKRWQRIKALASDSESRASSPSRANGDTADETLKMRRRQKQKRRSRSPKVPPGGSYRIPQQGQLQIVIKNPNKTAVKLFLVPYDLSDMEPGQKTFIRQRSYSAGPVIDMPLTSRKNLGTDRPEAAISMSEDPKDRPVLRYLVQVKICCLAKGRYFIYEGIRVVFANRVPDGKEKLRNEIQLPEPKYSTYRPGKESNVSAAPSTPDIALRRRSALDTSASFANAEDWLHEDQRRRYASAQSLPHDGMRVFETPPMPPLPLRYNVLPTLESRPASRQMSDSMDIDSEHSRETTDAVPSTPSPLSVTQPGWISPTQSLDGTGSCGQESPLVFRRDHSRERPFIGRSESLLSRRLNALAVRNGSHARNAIGP